MRRVSSPSFLHNSKLASLLTTLTVSLIVSSVSVSQAAPPPSVDYMSLLGSIRAHENGNISLDSVKTLFMPDTVMYTGAANDRPHAFVTLNKGSQELARIPHTVRKIDNAFSYLQTHGTPPVFQISSEGAHSIKVFLDKTLLAEVPFDVKLLGGDDPFAPDKKLRVEGPWTQHIALDVKGPADPNAHVRVRFWFPTSGAARENMDMVVQYRGQTIYETRSVVLADPNPGKSYIDLQFPKAAGGDLVKLSDFTKQDGVYELVVRREGSEIGRYSYEVKGGKIVHHKRSALDIQPHTAYLNSRYYEGQNRDIHELYWAVAGTGPAPQASAASASGPSAADLARWQVKSTASGPYRIVHSPVIARFDAGIAAGDGVIAFGTGGFNGVAYMNLGDTDSRSIPEGQSFRAAFQKVCGKKILLVNGNNLAVFDTVSGNLTKIPADQIHLALPIKAPHEANPVDASGYLVATINDASKVADRAVVKVIDLSGDTPKIISLANADFQGREATAVGVDAATGLVAVSSQRKKAIYTWKVAQNAGSTKHDISGFDSVETAPLVVTDGRVIYRDDAGTAKLRLLDPGSGSVQAISSIGPPVHGYTARNGRFAIAGVGSYGSAYPYAIGKIGGTPQTISGTGEAMKAGNSKLGFGQTAAFGGDGVLYIAGAGKSGLASGEFLMTSDGSSWTEVMGADGKALPAADVTVGNGFVAFRTGARNDTTISYAAPAR